MPSSVVIALPLTAATGVTHERISLPSSSTEQAPHCARPQPKRGPCRWSSLCSTYSRGVSRLAVTLCTRPFTLILSLLAIRPLLHERSDPRRGRLARPRTDDPGNKVFGLSTAWVSGGMNCRLKERGEGVQTE